MTPWCSGADPTLMSCGTASVAAPKRLSAQVWRRRSVDEGAICQASKVATPASWWVDCRHELPYNGDMALLDRISLDPTIRSGRPCIRGTRISVGDILGYLAGGMSEDQLLRDFPQLALDDIRACLAYAAEREQRTTAIPAA